MKFPLKDFYITQYFGELDPKYSGMGLYGHNGLDLRAKHGTPIYASHDGLANYQIDSGGGHGVVLISNDTLHGERYKTIYWHMVDPVVEPKFTSPIYGKNDVPVKAGDLLGYADNTGLSTGHHLHFGMKFVEANETNGALFNVFQQNGYLGAVDPLPYLPVIPYTFAPCQMGQRSTYVANLQRRLLQLGYFYTPVYEDYGIYGPRTAKAVFNFQKDHVKLTLGEKLLLGMKCGPKTIAALNKF